MLSEGRREGLRLALNRSISEPCQGPLLTVQQMTEAAAQSSSSSLTPDYDSSGSLCLPGSGHRTLALPLSPLASASMPASLCSESLALQRQRVCRKVKTIEPAEVARRITRSHKSRSFVILDLRPFFIFNVRHVRSAINLNCSDRLSRKRLQLRRATVVDLASPSLSSPVRESQKRRTYKEVIVYDETASDVESLPSDHPVFLVLSAIVEDHGEPLLMKGGFSNFLKNYPELCDEEQLKNHNINNNNNNGNTENNNCQDDNTGIPSHLMSGNYFNSSSVSNLASPDSEAAIERAAVTQVLPYLYLGNAKDAQNMELLQALGVSRVLNVTSRVSGYREESGLLCKTLPALDNGHQNLRQYFHEAIAFIDCCKFNGERVLVHCQAGISRSATIVIAYLMYANREPMISSYQTLKSLRTIISPNLNFMGQLLEWESFLRANSLESSEAKPCHQCEWKVQDNAPLATACQL
ncbi:dual specificity protein phosphatase 10 [Hyalella azteca]|uniref:protein-tyrosine-phosphatase n=1 Tax=Hyalella azteca TaxID=294128 RepID=A0A8B7NE63_HYAAZ|nr:dual specificity protein phosphatase 10 [Hyalella azteca]